MQRPKKLLWTLAGIVAAIVLVCLGIKLFDGRSPQEVAVHTLIGIRALNVEKYEADKVDMSDKGSVEVPGGIKFPRPMRDYRVDGMQVFEADPADDIYAGTWDVLYTDVVKAYEKMKAAGVDVRLHVGEKMDHVYPILPTPEGKAARKEIAEILSIW